MENDEAKVTIPIAPPPPVIVPQKPRVLLHEPDEEFTVKTCCGPTTSCDKPLMEFLARFVISTSVLGFCFVQLANSNGDSAFLCSTLSLILGTYLSGSSNTPPGKKDK
jgi:hypothetical protein